MRRKELGYTRLRRKFGGSRLREKESRFSMPGMRKLGSPGCEMGLSDLRLGERDLVGF